MSKFTSTASTSTKKVIEFADWNPKAHKYMAPKVNDKGGKSVTLISTQTSRSLHLNTPLLMTWGIADFANDDGTSDGKFKLSLNFPNPEYKTADTDLFLEKILAFQTQVIDDAVTNSELWFGKKKSKELVEDSFFPFVKYPKVKDPATNKATGAIDYSRPPSMSAKVPRYEQDDGSARWECDLFDTNYNLIFPTDSDVTPVDLVPKLSKIACTLQCTGIWVGGKGWGLTWKFISGVVKPKQTEAVRGVCHVRLTDTDRQAMENDVEDIEPEDMEPAPVPVVAAAPLKVAVETTVEDSDDDTAGPPPALTRQSSEPAEAVPPTPKVVKKIVKKKIVTA
jgi:hypothetical protein